MYRLYSVYSTNALPGQAVRVVLNEKQKQKNKNESQTHGLKSPIGDLRQKFNFQYEGYYREYGG